MLVPYSYCIHTVPYCDYPNLLFLKQIIVTINLTVSYLLSILVLERTLAVCLSFKGANVEERQWGCTYESKESQWVTLGSLAAIVSSYISVDYNFKNF